MHNMTKSPILWLLLMFYIYDILKSFRYALFKKLVYDYKKIRITCNKIAITYKLYFNNFKNEVGDRVNKRVYKFRCTWTIIYGMYIKFIDRALYLLIIMRLTIFAIILQSELSWMTQRYSSLMSEKSKLLLRNLPIFPNLNHTGGLLMNNKFTSKPQQPPQECRWNHQQINIKRFNVSCGSCLCIRAPWASDCTHVVHQERQLVLGDLL